MGLAHLYEQGRDAAAVSTSMYVETVLSGGTHAYGLVMFEMTFRAVMTGYQIDPKVTDAALDGILDRIQSILQSKVNGASNV